MKNITLQNFHFKTKQMLSLVKIFSKQNRSLLFFKIHLICLRRHKEKLIMINLIINLKIFLSKKYYMIMTMKKTTHLMNKVIFQ